MGIKIERIPPPLWTRPLIPISAILITFLLTASLVLLVDVNPLEAYYYFLIAPLSGRVSAIEVLVKSTPLLLTGAAVTFAFAGGYWNIGVEGQLLAGATAATAIVGQQHRPSPLSGVGFSDFAGQASRASEGKGCDLIKYLDWTYRSTS